MQVRRSVLFSSADKFFGAFVKFATLIVTARLLTPAEVGVAVLGMAVLGLASAIREFGGASYLIQVDEPTPARVQTVFTAQMAFTLPLALICILISGFAASFYHAPGLDHYLWVTAACFMLGPFSSSIYALMRRRMEFGPIALINIVTALSGAVATIGFAATGFGFMSFAWATLASGVVNLAFCLHWRPSFPIYRFAFHEWRNVFAFGAVDSVRNILYYLLDNIPLMVFGRTLGAENVGLYQRAISLSAMPSTTLLAGVAPVMLPAFANHAREKRELGQSYLQSLELTTVLLWPSTVFILIMAQPIVMILLGAQWTALVPLVQIIAAAYLIWFPVYSTNPVLIAAGGIRDTLWLALITIPLMVLVQSFASIWGVHAAVLSLFITVPWYVFWAVFMVKRRAPFKWRELGAVLGRNAVVSAITAIGPGLVFLASGGAYAVSILGGVIAGVLAGIGWLAGLWLMRHPMLNELQRAWAAVPRMLRGAS